MAGGRRLHRIGIAARLRLRDREGTDQLTSTGRRQKLRALRISAEKKDGLLVAQHLRCDGAGQAVVAASDAEAFEHERSGHHVVTATTGRRWHDRPVETSFGALLPTRPVELAAEVAVFEVIVLEGHAGPIGDLRLHRMRAIEHGSDHEIGRRISGHGELDQVGTVFG